VIAHCQHYVTAKPKLMAIKETVGKAHNAQCGNLRRDPPQTYLVQMS
jgi:hypothetical protein